MTQSRQSGFTLVEMLVALGILSVGVLIFGNITTSFQTVNQRFEGTLGTSSAGREMRLVMGNRDHCFMSIGRDAAMNPVTFQAVNVNEPENGEGIDFEIWLADQSGSNRLQKYLSATDPSFNKYKNLEVQRIRLTFPFQPTNFAAATSHNATGKVIVDFQQQIGGATQNTTEEFLVDVALSTNAGGVSTITGCTVEVENNSDREEVLDEMDATEFRRSNCLTQTVPEATGYQCPAGKIQMGGQTYWEGPNYAKVTCCDHKPNPPYPHQLYLVGAANCVDIQIFEGRTWECPGAKFVTGWPYMYHEGPNFARVRCCDIVRKHPNANNLNPVMREIRIRRAGDQDSFFYRSLEAHPWDCPTGTALAGGRTYNEGPNFEEIRCRRIQHFR